MLSGRTQDDVSEQKFIFEFFDSKWLDHWNSHTKEQLAKAESDRDRDFYLWYYVKVSDLFGMSATAPREVRRKACW